MESVRPSKNSIINVTFLLVRMDIMNLQTYQNLQCYFHNINNQRFLSELTNLMGSDIFEKHTGEAMPSVVTKFLYNSKKTTFIFEGCISDYPTNRGEKMEYSHNIPPLNWDTFVTNPTQLKVGFDVKMTLHTTQQPPPQTQCQQYLRCY